MTIESSDWWRVCVKCADGKWRETAQFVYSDDAIDWALDWQDENDSVELMVAGPGVDLEAIGVDGTVAL